MPDRLNDRQRDNSYFIGPSIGRGPKKNASEKNSEKFLVLDLLLSNGFKAYNILTLVCHVLLSTSMDR